MYLGEPYLGEPDLGEPKLGEPDLGEPDLGEPKLGEPDLGEPFFLFVKIRFTYDTCTNCFCQKFYEITWFGRKCTWDGSFPIFIKNNIFKFSLKNKTI